MLRNNSQFVQSGFYRCIYPILKIYDNIMGTTHWSILDSANGFGSGYSEVKRYEIAEF